MFEKIKEDIDAIFERDSEAESRYEVALCYPGFHAVLFHRAAHWCYIQGWSTVARFVSNVSRLLTGIEIHPAAKIGNRVFLKHGAGIVIGATAEIGDDCTLYQGVMLGSASDTGEKRHPTLGRGVTVGPNAQILGDFTIDDNAQIETNSIIVKNGASGGDVIGFTGPKTAGIKMKARESLPAPAALVAKVATLEETLRAQNEVIEALRRELGLKKVESKKSQKKSDAKVVVRKSVTKKPVTKKTAVKRSTKK